MGSLLHLELNIVIDIDFPLELQQEFLQLGAATICCEDVFLLLKT